MRALFVIGISVGLTLPHARSAHACGKKLAVRAAKIKRTKRSSNPSTILLLGARDSSLARELRMAGHVVDQVKSLGAAPKASYVLVLADEELVDRAKDRYPGAVMVTRRGSLRNNTKSVEIALRRPPRTEHVAGPRDHTEVREPKDSGPHPEGGPRQPSSTGGQQSITSDSGKSPDSAEGTSAADPPAPAPEETGQWTAEITYGVNRTQLDERAQERLRAYAGRLQRSPATAIAIEGHTDTTGSAAYNLRLSERRAGVAKSFLVGLGIDPSRIDVVPRGEEAPAYQPGTSAKNRRILLRRN